MPWRTMTGAASAQHVVTMTHAKPMYIVLRNGDAILKTRPMMVRA
jgi:hypothetical protein